MQYTICDVRVSELLTKQVSVPPWEVPILEALHGANVKEVGTEEIDRDPPSPEDEYQRLCNKYRGNKEDANSVVAMVYGPFEAGKKKIGEEMREAGIDIDPESQERRERAVPAVRSSRMSVGIRDREARRELEEEALRTAGTPNRAGLVRPTGIAPSNADPKLGEDIGQQSKLRRAERTAALQPAQPPTRAQQRRAEQQGLGRPTDASRQPQSRQSADPTLEARKLEARQARQRFEARQSSAQPSPRSPAPIRPR